MRQALKAIVLLAAGLFVYAPVFHGDWIWDDQLEITTNSVVKDPSGLIPIWKGKSGSDYLPVKTTVQWLYFQIAGMNAPSWHMLNIGLHLLNAFVVWKLFSKLGVPQAWIGGLIFAVHPILVESVAWISEMKNTLSLAFLLPAMLAYRNFTERGRMSDYFIALVLYIAAVLSKASVVMFPLVILLYAWWKSGRITMRDMACSLPFFAVSLLGGVVTVYFQFTRAIGDAPIPVGGVASRLATAGMAILFYFSKCVLPFGLVPSYPRWRVDPPTLLQLSAWLVTFAVLLWLWTNRKTWGRHALLGVGFFLLNLLPILGFVTMSYMQMTWVADHFVYLPALGIIGLVAAGAGTFWERFAQYRRPFALAGGCALGFLILTSHTYARVFVNETVLWTYTLRNNPEAWHAHLRLGKILLDQGYNEGAFFHNAESVRLRPDLAETHNNYAVSLQIQGEHGKAIAHLREAIRLDPKDIDYTVNLADFFILQGRDQEGAEIYRELLKAHPGNPLFLTKYGSVLYSLGFNDEAIACLQKALTINPDRKDAREKLNAAQLKKADGENSAVPDSPGGNPPLH